MKSNIIVIGFMGTGKTTIGQILAEKMNKNLLEMDEIIAEKAGKSIPEIFAEDGETRFRELEMAVSKELSESKDMVISTGGGIILNKLNLDYLKKDGTVVLLEATAQDIFNRISIQGKEKRPLLNKPDPIKEIRDLLSFRKPFYSAFADCKVSTYRKSPEQIAEEILIKLDEENQVFSGKNLGSLFNELSGVLLNDEEGDISEEEKKSEKDTIDPEYFIIKTCCDYKGTDYTSILKQIFTDKPKNFRYWHYNAIVPGILLSVIRNYQTKMNSDPKIGSEFDSYIAENDTFEFSSITKDKIVIGIKRGTMLPYGTSGYLGISGHVIGAGITISTLIGATPKTENKLTLANEATNFALSEILKINGALSEKPENIVEHVIQSTLKFLELKFKLRI